VAIGDAGALEPFCTGILLDATHVLTAAHCVVLDGRQPFGFDLSSDTKATTDSDLLPVTAAETYPDFVLNPGDPNAPLHDIAVLTLSRAATNRTPSRWSSSPSLEPDQEVTIVGFGPTEKALAPNTFINDAPTTVSAVSPTEFVVAPEPSPQACFGDSGGPAFSTGPAGDVLVGIASRAAVEMDQNCSQGAIYTRLDAFRGWVEGVVQADQRSSSAGQSSGCDVAPSRASARGNALSIASLVVLAAALRCVSKRDRITRVSRRRSKRCPETRAVPRHARTARSP
jgi:secreted trypsin-like serine protease